MNQSELVLAILAAGNGAIHTPVQIQKLFFLVDKKLPNLGGPFFNFVPHDYGPFDKEVYRVIEVLSGKGDAEIIKNPGERLNEYRLTPVGQKKGEKILHSLDSNLFDSIIRLSEFVRSLSFAELVSAIYKAYPEMRVNSVFKETEG